MTQLYRSSTSYQRCICAYYCSIHSRQEINQSKCPSTDDVIKKIWSVCTVNFSSIKKINHTIFNENGWNWCVLLSKKCWKREEQIAQSFSDTRVVDLNLYGNHVNVLYLKRVHIIKLDRGHERGETKGHVWDESRRRYCRRTNGTSGRSRDGKPEMARGIHKRSTRTMKESIVKLFLWIIILSD